MTKVVDVRTSDFGEDVAPIRNESLDNAAYRFGNFLTRKLDYGPEDTLIDYPHDASLRLPMDDRARMSIVAGKNSRPRDPAVVCAASRFRQRPDPDEERSSAWRASPPRGLPGRPRLLLRPVTCSCASPSSASDWSN